MVAKKAKSLVDVGEIGFRSTNTVRAETIILNLEKVPLRLRP
jgi:hypothetical protein